MDKNLTDVVIIGGGLAGLAAANKLMKKTNLDFIILEARPIIGGRTYTCKSEKGYKVDLGASWIGPKQTRMLSICHKLKIPIIQQYEKGKNIILFEGRKILYSGLIPKINIRDLINYWWQQYLLDRLSNTVNLKNPMKTKNAKQLDSVTFETYIDQKFREIPSVLIKRAFELVFGVKTNKISLLHALQYIKSGQGCDSLFKGEGGAQQYKIEGGTSNFTDEFSKKFKERIILNSPVTSINQTGELVKVYTNNRVYKCARVIVAVPPRLLKEIKFQPDLPQQKQFLIQNQKAYGHIYKFILIYDNPFWRKQYSGFCFNAKGLLNMTFDGETDKNQKYFKLIGFLDQEQVELLKRDKKKITVQLLKELEVFYGEEVYVFRDIIYGDILSDDKYINGCPTGINGVGVLTQSEDIPEQPNGKIYWASTETSDIWQGFMEGAIRSGERAVHQIIGQKYYKKVSNSYFENAWNFIKYLIVILLSILMIQIAIKTLDKYFDSDRINTQFKNDL